MLSRFLNLKSPKPVCLGTGLIALDVLINGDVERPGLWAGGSCGNVLAILAYLGWHSYPVARFGKDQASKIVVEDLARWGVRLDLVERDSRIITPVVIERLKSGPSTHVFEFNCPNCGAPLPRNRPLPLALSSKIVKNLPRADVFYFDRVSRAAVELAKAYRSRGTLIVFEPYRFTSNGLFQKLLKLTHVLKYSYEQIDAPSTRSRVPLEIQTLGSEGLRYRLRGMRSRGIVWQKSEAFHVDEMVDSAGAGDWCTAGIIHVLGQYGANGLANASLQEMETAIEFAQSLAALSCRYEGARGLMYDTEKAELELLIRKLVAKKEMKEVVSTTRERAQTLFYHICPACRRAHSYSYPDGDSERDVGIAAFEAST